MTQSSMLFHSHLSLTMLWSVIAIFIALYWFWCKVKYRRFYELSKHLKTDIKAWPLIGHAHVMFGSGLDRMKGCQRIAREANKHGGISYIWLAYYYAVVVTDAADIDLITKTCLDKGEIVDLLKDFFGGGSVVAPVSVWRPKRKFLASIFTVKNLNNFVNVFDEKSRNLVNNMKHEAKNGAFTFWQYITTYSMDSLCETTLGVPIDTRSEKLQPFLKSFDDCMYLQAERMFKPIFHLNFIYKNLKRYKKFLACKNYMYDFIRKIIESKRKALENVDTTPIEKEQNPNSYKSILELQIVSGGQHGFTDVVIGEETLVLVLAGTESSANSLAYTAVLLSQHADVQEKAYKELKEIFGDSDRAVTPEDIPKMKYLDAVIRESLRLYPPFPVVVRKITQDTTLPSGVTLVPGCVVLCHIWGTHRNPKYWGDDTESFRPERFLEGMRHPAAFMAFSNGQRNCLGYQYAMMSMKTAVATLLRNYRIIPAEEPDCHGRYPPLKTEYNFIMKDADSYRVKLEARTK